MKPDEKEKIPLRVESLFYDLQNRVMEDVVRRISKTGGITATADYQIEKVNIFGNSTEYIESEIKRISEMTDAELWKIYDEVVDKDYTRNKGLYEQVNAKFIPYEDNEVLQAWTKAIVGQTQGDIRNITKSMGFSLNYGGKQVFTPFSEYYQKNLDRACMDIVTGSFSYNTVLRRVVKEMTASGIRTVDYASGYSSRATVASKRAIMTGVNQLCGQINDKNAEELGTDTFEVTAHANARPSHRSWQGQVFTKKQLVSICGLGSVDGLQGANCRHNHMAFIPGISVRAYTDEQLRNMAEKEDTPFTWQGKEYKGHESSQQQRHMETVMRKQRSDVKLLQKGKAAKEEVATAKINYQNTLREYQVFSKKANLSEQMERVYMDGLGRIAPGKPIPQYSDGGFFSFMSGLFSTPLDKKLNAFDKSLNEIKNVHLKTLLEQSRKRSVIEEYGKRKSKYSAGKIFLAKEADLSTIAHESFHEIDEVYGISSSKMLSSQIKADYKKLTNYAKGYGKSIEDMLYLKYPDAFTTRGGKLVIKEKYRGISDILNGASNGKISLGYGHRNSYWELPNRVEAETWAQFGRILFQNDEEVTAMAKYILGDTYKEILRIVKEMIK